MATLYLTEVRRLDEQRKFRFTWSDGASAELDYDTVRGWCPCAGCQGHGPLQMEFQPPPSPVKPSKVEPVGNYAISIHWSDGHATGIYRFDFLRQLCSPGKAAPRSDEI